MVKSSRSHYASHCIALHYDDGDDDDDDIGFGNDVALASDDDDSSGNDPAQSLHFRFVFLFSMMPFL